MRDYISKILIMICLIVFCGSAYFLIDYVLENKSAQNQLDELAEKNEKIGLDGLYKENNDIVGWVKIDGTKINYPVMQTPDDPEYYLYRNFKGEHSEAGTPFADAKSVIAGATKVDGGEIAEKSTCNWLVYGHHMKFGTMFHDLLDYKDKEFWKANPRIEFTTLKIDSKSGKISEETVEYDVIAAAYSEIKDINSKEFKYYKFADFSDKESFAEYISGIKAESEYDTGLDAEYGDQLLTLSTCAYQTENGRFYIVGREVK